MSDQDKPVKALNTDRAVPDKMIAIDVNGKDPGIWETAEPRFVMRLANSFRRLLGGDIRPEVTANRELLDTADTLARSAQAAAEAPQLKNLERQASVRLKLAEAQEREAQARKLSLEADMLEMEVERKRVHESQAIIDRLIMRGELIPVEKDGELVLVYKKRALD